MCDINREDQALLTEWKDNADHLDSFICEELGTMSAVLPHSIEGFPTFPGFVRHLAYVILSFLNKECQDNHPQSLFIQIPVEDFSNKIDDDNEDDQKRLYELVLGTVATCLAKATLEFRWQEIQIDGPIDYLGPNNTWYNAGDQFLVHGHSLNDRSRDEILCCSRERNGNRILKRSVRVEDGANPFVSVDDEYIRQHQGTIFRICPQGNPSVLEAQAEFKALLSFLQKTVQYPLLSYRSAALVSFTSYSPVNDDIELPSVYFPLFKQVNDVDDLTRAEHTDIIVVLGDKKYKNRRNEFTAKAAKKIIYIGTVPPYDGIDTYPFSYREMYRYCAREPEWCDSSLVSQYERIPFPWMDETLRDMELLLDRLAENDESLTRELRQAIENKLRFAFSDISFSKDKWDNRKDGLLTDIDGLLWDCSDDTFSALESWIKETSYESAENPKISLIHEKGLSPDLIIGKRESYKNRVRALRGNGNTIVLDAACDFHSVTDTACNSGCKYILSHLLYSNVIALYYSCEDGLAKNLKSFLDRDTALMQSPMREDYKTSISLPHQIDVNETREVVRLEDYFNLISQMGSWYRSGVETEVLFVNGEKERIDGDVLVVETADDGKVFYTRRAVEDLYVGGEEGELAICYYRSPDDFNTWVRLYCRLPAGQGINDYVILWKTAFREYVNGAGEEPRRVIQAISRETGIKESILLCHLTGDRSFMRSERDWGSIVSFLLNHELVTETDAQYLSAARNLWQSDKNYGRQLKEELFTYKESGGIQIGRFLRCLINENVSMEIILEQCLQEMRVRAINIINN